MVYSSLLQPFFDFIHCFKYLLLTTQKTLEATHVTEFLTWCYKYESAWSSSVKETRPVDQAFFKDYGWIESSL